MLKYLIRRERPNYSKINKYVISIWKIKYLVKKNNKYFGISIKYLIAIIGIQNK